MIRFSLSTTFLFLYASCAAVPDHDDGWHVHLHDHDHDGNWGGDVAAALALAIVPFAVPVMACDDDHDEERRFLPHPYAESRDQYLIERNHEGANKWALRFALERGWDLEDKDATRFGVLYTTSDRVGVEGQVAYTTEDRDGDVDERVTAFDINAFLRFAEHERAVFRVGLGYRFAEQDGEDLHGINGTYAFDVFPASPWVLSAELDVGTLRDETVLHVRGSVGVTWGGIELYGGYDYLEQDDEEVHGPLVGIRLWY